MLKKAIIGTGAAVVAVGGAIWAIRSGNKPDARPRKEILNIGVVGVGGRGYYNLMELSSENAPANIVGLCDVDDRALAEAGKLLPAGVFSCNDFRELVARPDVDAVLCATPDHTHAWVTLAALRAGKHVYCEKPLAHSMEETRLVSETARQMNRVTQMGIQIHAKENYRRVVELIRAGVIGTVKEVHVFVTNKWAADGPARPGTPPAGLHYDLWLGGVPPLPYSPDYVPQAWRCWWAFGEGTLGDMGCHHLDLPFWALGLGAPTSVRAEGPPPDADRTPPWLIVHYEFPARGSAPPVKLTWYDGGKRPAELLADLGLERWSHGVLFVGSEGSLIADYDRHKLAPDEKFQGFKPPAATIAPSAGHHHEWVAACLAEKPEASLCNFNYSGPLTEAVLLGCIAHRTGKTLEWDAAKMKIANAPEAEQLLRLRYRDGWKL